MLSWSGRAGAAVVCGAVFALGACGKSRESVDRTLHPPTGMAASAGAPTCAVGDTVYQNGDTFGDCNECYCLNGNVTCLLVACPTEDGGGGGNGAAGGNGMGGRAAGGRGVGGSAAGGGGSSASGVGGSGAGGGGSSASGVGGSSAGGSGAGAAGSSGIGGAGSNLGGAFPATGGSAGTDGGLAGGAGAPTQCGQSPAGTFCILGTPADDGKVDLVAGMPLAISVHTTGCRNHRCSNEIVSASCRNVLGSEGSYWISPDICFAGDGEPCTGEQCGGVADTSCETGITLEAGQYTVALGGSAVSIGFTVPSHVALTELCH